MKTKILRKIDLMASLALCLVIAAVLPLNVSAESKSYDGECYFNGHKIVSTFNSGEIADAVSDLQPGDDVSFTVKYTNEYSESTDWYMENEVIQTLEKADEARKVPSGTGTPEDGGYTYELIHEDKNGNTSVLFSNSDVGGEARPADMQGLEQATNALDEWFYIQTLEKGESGVVTLNVAFDGETEVNDYMDTDGGLEVRFAVELTPTGSDSDSGSSTRRVETGDNRSLLLWTAVLFTSALLALVLGFIKRRRDRVSEEVARDE